MGKQPRFRFYHYLTHHSYDSAYKSEVGEMFRVDARCRVDLKCVVGVPSILKEAVHWVQHLMGEVEEPFPGRPTIVQTFFPTEHDVESPAEVLGLEPHDL